MQSSCDIRGWDHPRVCGEKYLRIAVFVLLLGSPPRMRGKDVQRNAEGQEHGITPAYAGKSRPGLSDMHANGDHPRVCGEKRVRLAFICGIRGSPPRMRGKVAPVSPIGVSSGITPAYAGKRLIQTRHAVKRQDHPRVCGEKDNSKVSGNGRQGSPPRMRGKEHRDQPAGMGPWITPAYAGKSCQDCLVSIESRDHPRVCGEKGRIL